MCWFRKPVAVPRPDSPALMSTSIGAKQNVTPTRYWPIWRPEARDCDGSNGNYKSIVPFGELVRAVDTSNGTLAPLPVFEHHPPLGKRIIGDEWTHEEFNASGFPAEDRRATNVPLHTPATFPSLFDLVPSQCTAWSDRVWGKVRVLTCGSFHGRWRRKQLGL